MATTTPTIGTNAQRVAQQDAIGGGLIRPRDYLLRTDLAPVPAKLSVFNAVSNKSSGRVVNQDVVISGVNLSGQFNSSRGAQLDISGRGCIILGASSKSSNRIFIKPRVSAAANLGGKSHWQRTTWNTNNAPVFETTIRTLAANTFANAIIQAGLLLTHVFDKTTDNDQVKFWFASGTDSAKLYVTLSIGNVDTTTYTGVDLAANTNYKLQISVESDRTVTCYVNGARVSCYTAADGSFAYQTPALTANVNLIPHVGIRAQTNSAARVKLGAYYLQMAKNLS